MNKRNYQVFGKRVIVEVEPEFDRAMHMQVPGFDAEFLPTVYEDAGAVMLPVPLGEPEKQKEAKPIFGGVKLSRGRVVAIGERRESNALVESSFEAGFQEGRSSRSRKRPGIFTNPTEFTPRDFISAMASMLLGSKTIELPEDIGIGDVILFAAGFDTMQVPEDENLRVVEAGSIIAVLAPHRISGITDSAAVYMFEQVLRTLADSLDKVERLDQVKTLADLARRTVEGSPEISAGYGEDR